MILEQSYGRRGRLSHANRLLAVCFFIPTRNRPHILYSLLKPHQLTDIPGHWTPPALHPVTLTLAILVPLALLTTLQLLLNRSQRDSGLIFAPDINALPLSRTFLYQYFPTIVAVIFSIFWSWIDLEVKRLEPYYRLSRAEGALGKDSLLLCYPFSFLPFVPIRALKER
jgi:hypothetical protein